MADKSLMTCLKSHFGKIYILSLVEREDRRYLIEKQLKALGIDAPDSTDYIRYFYATTFAHNNIIANAFNESKKGKFTKANEYDCARNHYAMVKICYVLGCQHCLILEDDLLFRTDPKILQEYIENLPEDYDIAQFGGFTTDKRIKDYCGHLNDAAGMNKYWCKHHDVGLWTTSMYAMSRRGMEFYILFMDNFFWVADGPMYKAPINDTLIDTYLARTPLVIQADKDIIKSDIRNKENDSIDYNNSNVYEEEIDRSDFFNID